MTAVIDGTTYKRDASNDQRGRLTQILVLLALIRIFRYGTSKPEWGDQYSGPPWGDDPKDQAWIKRGIQFAKQGFWEDCEPD